MTDFLLELLSEEIPARMQAKAQEDLARLFAAQLAQAGLAADAIETFATPRRLALIARGLPAETQAVREETKGPRSSAPPQALEGFLRKTGLAREQLEERDGVLFAVIEKPGRSTAALLAEAIPAIVRAFPWPKSMRWGAASASTESPRWVRPLQGIVALLGEEIVDFEIAGIRSGAATVGHRFHHPGIITIGGAHDYAEKLRACHVIVDPAERRRIIADGAAAAAREAGLELVEDEGLLVENAGLTEWPVPLLGSFDPAFLEVPREVIQLTMRTNQKYFALLRSSPERGGEPPPKAVVEGALHTHRGSQGPLHQPAAVLERDRVSQTRSWIAGGNPKLQHPPRSGEDQLAPAFVCTANIEPSDGGAAIVAGNRKVLAARLADARFFWEQDLKVPLEEQANKLGSILFHEKLGTLASKVRRVEILADWIARHGALPRGTPGRDEQLKAIAAAARLAKADLVTGSVGEFPELQGTLGGYLARAQGQPEPVADAIRDHYKPVGQGDEVPASAVTAILALADKLDTLVSFFTVGEKPSGSRDPFALRRAALGALQIITAHGFRLPLRSLLIDAGVLTSLSLLGSLASARMVEPWEDENDTHEITAEVGTFTYRSRGALGIRFDAQDLPRFEKGKLVEEARDVGEELFAFFGDRLKVQQREAGVRHDLIDAVFALGAEEDVVRLLARVEALQAFVETPDGANLLIGYKRAANIIRKEGWKSKGGKVFFPYAAEREEDALDVALDNAEPEVEASLKREDFGATMAILARLRAPIDAFFDKVTVNDEDPKKRENRLALLARIRSAVHQVADFSKIEG